MYNGLLELHVDTNFLCKFTFIEISFQSKGGILSKACDYIQDLRAANNRMAESLKETERLSVDLDIARQQCEELKNENAILRAQLQSHGLIPDINAGGT